MEGRRRDVASIVRRQCQPTESKAFRGLGGAGVGGTKKTGQSHGDANPQGLSSLPFVLKRVLGKGSLLARGGLTFEFLLRVIGNLREPQIELLDQDVHHHETNLKLSGPASPQPLAMPGPQGSPRGVESIRREPADIGRRRACDCWNLPEATTTGRDSPEELGRR